MANKDSVTAMPINGWACDDDMSMPLPPPHCTIAGVWSQAIAKGAPAGNTVAELGYRMNGVGKQPVWYFTVKGTKFSEMIPDHCP
jgi:hypothetical protein